MGPPALKAILDTRVLIAADVPPLEGELAIKAREMTIAGAWIFDDAIYHGSIGSFVEQLDTHRFAEAVGHPLSLGHMTVTTLDADTLRGVHYGGVPPGQAKYVTCVAGAFWDVVADLRIGSPTFGLWQGLSLDAEAGNAVYLGEGLGHGYLSLQDRSTLVYVSSQPFVEGREHRVNAMDEDLNIAWPVTDPEGRRLLHRRGPKDSSAPSLADVRHRLPRAGAVDAYVASLASEAGQVRPV